MRSIFIAAVVAIGAGLLGASGLSAAPANGGAINQQAAVDKSGPELVHCRRYRHTHHLRRRSGWYTHRCG